MANAIELRNVSKVYRLYDSPSDRMREALFRKVAHRDFFALSDVSLDVPKGQCLGIVGVNGSGKSTLLKLITGVLTPSAGSIHVDGRISALLELGAGFNGEYSGMENIFLNGTILGYSRAAIEERLDAILAFADIGDFVHQPVKTYSSGMFVRLAFAVAIHVDPDILIVDEALAVGDLYFQAKCYRKFDAFKQAGKTILFVTHSLDSVLKYCDAALLLHEGHLLSQGSPHDVIDHFKQIMTKRLPDVEPRGDTPQADTLQNESADSPNDLPWRAAIRANPEQLEYGDFAAQIVDYGLFDGAGAPCQCIQQGDEFEIRMRVRVDQPIEDLIYAFVIKDFMGVEITGTNTLYEGIDVDAATGAFCISFRLRCQLAAGQYLISLGITSQHGALVHHRLYDLIAFEVIASKRCAGVLAPNAHIQLSRSPATGI